MSEAFTTAIEEQDGVLYGPWRAPLQMLATQSYGGHASIHDDATAQALGFEAATIEGPTHFSQFAPLCVALWGDDWLARGGLSSHFRNPVFEGEETRAIVERPAPGETQASIRMEKRDGTEVLRGTASFGRDHPPSALAGRLAGLETPPDLVILRDTQTGTKTPRIAVRMGLDDHMGELYPFSLADKLKRITEPSPVYDRIIPAEMISVLLNYVAQERPFPAKGPTVGLIADQEIEIVDGPVLVGADYELEREIIAISGSRRTESMWIETRLYRPGSDELVARMWLNNALLKASYTPYEAEYAALYGPPG